MKSKICSIMLSFLTVGAFAQDIHSGKVVGSFDYGNKDVTTIYDEVTGCERRTTPHEKGLFIPNENVEIIIDNKQLAEVVKPQMTEKVYTKKGCDFNISNPLNPFDELGKEHNELLSEFKNDVLMNIVDSTIAVEDVINYFELDSIQRLIVTNFNLMPDSKAEQIALADNYPLDIEHPEVLNLLFELKKIVYNNGLDFEQKINQIKKQEFQLLDNSLPQYLRNVPEEKIESVKNILLASCAVARYSLYYWTPTTEGGLGNTGYSAAPPDWVYADLKALAVSYWFALNPWLLLASTACASALSAVTG